MNFTIEDVGAIGTIPRGDLTVEQNEAIDRLLSGNPDATVEQEQIITITDRESGETIDRTVLTDDEERELEDIIARQRAFFDEIAELSFLRTVSLTIGQFKVTTTNIRPQGV